MILTAFYDLEYGPVSYDFATWLVRAMKERDSRKCSGLHVVIVPKEDGLGGFSRHWGNHDEHAARWRLWHIVVSCCPLAGATATIAASRDQAHKISAAAESEWWPEGKAHFMGPLIDAARGGEKIPLLRASEGARRYIREYLIRFSFNKKVITTTLRQQETDPSRNSDLEAWSDLLRLAEQSGFAVFELDDTHVALQSGTAFVEQDPDLRLALYEQAAMNFIGNNGPQELLKFSSAPYRIVGLGIESWREHFRKYFHMEYGDQLPWATPQQKLVYKPDTFEVLREEFETWAGGTS